jgi:ribonucleotide monophosphatase NagD (HAD superfamily)
MTKMSDYTIGVDISKAFLDVVAGFQDVATMCEAIQKRRSHLCISEDLGPLREAEVGCDDGAGPLIEFTEQMEQQRTAGHDGKKQALKTAGKPSKVALTAVMRKLIILANELIKQDRFWQEKCP